MRLSAYPSWQDQADKRFFGQVSKDSFFFDKEVTTKLSIMVPTLLWLHKFNKSGLAPHRGFTSHCHPNRHTAIHFKTSGSLSSSLEP